MTRKVFYSFHYKPDSWRVQTVRNIGLIEGQTLLNPNAWETLEKGGDKAIQQWIDQEMIGKSCNVVLIGSQTASRRWVKYEFTKAWGDGKPVLGIHIHRLLDQHGRPTAQGLNPFAGYTVSKGADKVPFDKVVPVYNPAGTTSKDVYSTIASNIDQWVEDAFSVRKQWP